MRTINIELRFDDDTPEKVKVIEIAAKMAAKHLFTTALLVSGKRKPQIAMHGSDFFSSAEEISLADDIPQDDEPAEENTDPDYDDQGNLRAGADHTQEDSQ